MRLNTKIALGVSAAAMLTSLSARAETDVNVTTAADSAKLGAEFRAEYKYDNNQLMKVPGYEPKGTSSIDLDTAKVKLNGNLNKATEYAFRFNLYDPKARGPMDYGYGTHWFADMFGMSIGRMKVLQGGWDNLDNSFRDHAEGAYQTGGMTFNNYEDMIALHVKAAGKVSLQVLNDVHTGTEADPRVKTPGEWNTKQHPTYVVGWQGDFNGMMPLVDIGSYDNNKSMWLDVGFKAKIAGVDASLDYNNNKRSSKGADSSGKSKGYDNVATNIALKARYDIKDTAMPFLYFANYDVKQANDSASGRKDLKVNSKNVNATTNATTYNWDDNGQTFGIGADFGFMGKNWNPYVALVNNSGKWDDKGDGTAVSHSDMVIRVGVLGAF